MLLNQQISELQSSFDMMIGRRNEIKERLKSEKKQLKKNKKQNQRLDKCITLLKCLYSTNENKITKLFEHTISSGLKDLFDNSYDFKFLLKTRGNSSACEYQIKTKEFPGYADIIMCHGKSVQDIVSIIMRIILTKLDKRSRDIVILDEPLSGLESARKVLAGQFICEICEKFNIQLIMVTHSEELIAHANKEIKINAIK